jgi:hypothetical protein
VVATLWAIFALDAYAAAGGRASGYFALGVVSLLCFIFFCFEFAINIVLNWKKGTPPPI